MPEPDLSETQPNGIIEDTQPNPVEGGGNKNFPRWLPLTIVLVLVLIGLLAGYSSGMGLRYSTENSVLNGKLSDQFRLGQEAMAAGQYEVAQLHFRYVLENNPNFPGIKTAYADLLLRMQITPTATYTPTPAFTPTVDTRGVEEQFKSAQDLLKAEDWNGTLAALDSLRKASPEYQTAQVDGMYYTALYQRGFYEIRPIRLTDDCHNTNLSAGINDFTQAEHFAPLDDTATSLRTYSRLYIAGSSFWDQDWKAAQELFSQVMAAYPSLMDSSCITATDRWRQATLQYAGQLANNGEWCDASEQFDQAFTVNSPDNEKYQPAATEASNECNGNNSSQDPLSVTPTSETPLAPAETPTETPTGG